MKKVMPVILQFKYADAIDSEKHLQTAYNRIFMIAKQNIIERKKQQSKKKK